MFNYRMRHLLAFFPFIFLISLPGCDSGRRQNQLAQIRTSFLPVTVPTFDAKRAFEYLLAQTNFGPRNPGSMGHGACLKYLNDELAQYADAVNLQQFTGRDGKGNEYKLTNVIASFNLQATTRVLLSAHWDTRPWADQDPNPANHTKPILGANDGASGVAVLLEVARQMKAHTPPIGVDIVLFDGEDLGITGSLDYFSVGSKYFAANKPAGFQPRFGINLDMIGDKQLRIQREQNSDRFAPEVNDLVFGIAKELGIQQFDPRRGEEIYDDHLPLNHAGIRTINLIDFNYPDESNRYWHTLEDTPDKCSAESLEAVGKVILQFIYAKAATF
jgi:glutaminyl-peptide cyclotransferase